MDETTDRLAAELITQAQRAGATAAQVQIETHTAQPVNFEANRLKAIERTQAATLALWVWRDGRPGVAVAAGAVDPAALVAKALAASALNSPEPPAFASGGTQRFAEVFPPLTPADLIPWGQALIELVRQEFPDVLCQGGLSWEESLTRLVNSQGLDYSYRTTALEVGLACEWVRGDDFLAVAEQQRTDHRFQPEPLGQRLCQALAWAKQNVPIPAGHWPVLLTRKAADLLWEPVQAALNGRQVLDGASPWANRRGERVAHPHLTCRQQPQVPLHGCPFDDEGVLTQPLTLIEQGILTRFYTDQYTARQWGEPSTGNGFRPGLTRAPFPSLVNWWVEPGALSDAALLRQLDTGLVVDQVLGGGADISGDFAVNVDLGYWVQGGHIQGRVKDTMIAGNVYEILQADLVLGAEADWQDGSFTPAVIVDKITITSKD
ncbi:MAG: metallopeptidase TldD-related protein [Gloeomargarita sp. DG02_4_bins_56]